MKELLKDRSKIFFATAIVSTAIFILCIPVLLEYSKYMSYTRFVGLQVENFTTRTVYCILGGNMYVQFNFAVIAIIMIAALFNVVGFIFKKREFNFMAICLFLILNLLKFLSLRLIW